MIGIAFRNGRGAGLLLSIRGTGKEDGGLCKGNMGPSPGGEMKQRWKFKVNPSKLDEGRVFLHFGQSVSVLEIFNSLPGSCLLTLYI